MKRKLFKLFCSLLLVVVSLPQAYGTSTGWGEKLFRTLPFGNKAADFFWGNQKDRLLKGQHMIYTKSEDSIKKLRQVMETAAASKRKVEELYRIKNDAIDIGKKVRSLNYIKSLLSLVEDESGLSLDPSNYIPETEYTHKLRRNLRLNTSRERHITRRANSVLRNTKRAVINQDFTSHEDFLKAMYRAKLYDETVHSYVKSRDTKLAGTFEKLAEQCLKANQGILKIIEDPKSNMTAAEKLKAYEQIQNNIAQAAESREKANNFYEKSTKLSKEDEEKLGQRYESVLLQSLYEMEKEARASKR